MFPPLRKENHRQPFIPGIKSIGRAFIHTLMQTSTADRGITGRGIGDPTWKQGPLQFFWLLQSSRKWWRHNAPPHPPHKTMQLQININIELSQMGSSWLVKTLEFVHNWISFSKFVGFGFTTTLKFADAQDAEAMQLQNCRRMQAVPKRPSTPGKTIFVYHEVSSKINFDGSFSQVWKYKNNFHFSHLWGGWTPKLKKVL